jgi:hypothetical protein
MSFIEILVLTEAIAILIVGYILFKQNKSQNELINNLKTYTSIIDIDKLKQYDSFREEAVFLKAGTIIADGLTDDITKLATEKVEVLSEKYKEYMIFSWDIIYNNPPDVREVLLNKYFPSNKESIKRVLTDKDKNNS